MVSIINDTIIDDLSYQANWGLGTILIKIWHVKVIHEVDKDLTWWWTEGTSSSLVDLRFDDNLKCFGIGVRVEVDGSVDDAFLIKSGEVISDDSGLTSTGGSDIDHTFSGLDMHVEEESLSGGLGGWDDEAAEKSEQHDQNAVRWHPWQLSVFAYCRLTQKTNPALHDRKTSPNKA